MTQSIWTREYVTADEWAAEAALQQRYVDEHNERESRYCSEVGLDHIPNWADTTALDLAKNHGLHDFEILVDLDGNIVPATVFKNNYGGHTWRVTATDAYDSPVVAWITYSTADKIDRRQKHYRKHGYQLATVTNRALPYGRSVLPVKELPPVAVRVLEDEPVLDLV